LATPRPDSTVSTALSASPALLAMLDALATRARAAGAFGPVAVDRGAARLVAPAPSSPEPAEFRVDVQAGQLFVSLVTPARYLSQSIEQDLVHQGDKIEDLLADELVDVESPVTRLPVEHFRDPQKLFTFRSPLPIDLARAAEPESIELAAKALLAYSACFSPLGDLSAGDED
jgi:hypothetical protein